MQNTNGVNLHEEILQLPVKNSDEIVKLVEDTLKSNTTIAVIDHIPSNFAFTMPVSDIVKVCHNR